MDADTVDIADSIVKIMSDIQNWLKLLQEGQPTEQISAIQALVKHQAKEAIPYLVDLLDVNEPIAKSTAVWAIGQLGNPSPSTNPGALLIPLLRDEEMIVKTETIEALMRLNYQSASDSILSQLEKEKDPTVKAYYIEALGQFKFKPSVQFLINSFPNEQDEIVRAEIVRSLSLIEQLESLAMLNRWYEQENSLKVKIEVLGANFLFGSQHEIVPLLLLLESNDQEILEYLLNYLEGLFFITPPNLLSKVKHRVIEKLNRVKIKTPYLQSHINYLINFLFQKT